MENNRTAELETPTTKDWRELPEIIEKNAGRHRGALIKYEQLQREYAGGAQARAGDLAALRNTSAVENLDKRARGLPLVSSDAAQAKNLPALDQACEDLRKALAREKSLQEQGRLLNSALARKESSLAAGEGEAAASESRGLERAGREIDEAVAKSPAGQDRMGLIGGGMVWVGVAMFIYMWISVSFWAGVCALVLFACVAYYFIQRGEKSTGAAKKAAESEKARLAGESGRRLAALREENARKRAALQAEHAAATRDLEAPLAREREDARGKRAAALAALAIVARRAEACAAERDVKPAALGVARRDIEASAAEWEKTWLALPPYLRNQWRDEERGAGEVSFWEKPFAPLPEPLPFFVDGVLAEAGADGRGGAGAARFPHLQSFIGSGKFIKINTLGSEGAGVGMLRGLALQLAAIYMRRAQFTFIAPLVDGGIFPMVRDFEEMGLMRDSKAAHGMGTLDNDSLLKKIIEDINRIEGRVLRGGTFEDARKKSGGQAERYEFIFVANFPENYDARSIQYLNQIARKGPNAGKYVFLHMSQKLAMPEGGWTWEDFEDGLSAIELNVHSAFAPAGEWLCAASGDISGVLDALRREPPKPEAPPAPAIVEAPKPRPVWETRKPEEWWTDNSDGYVEAVVGVSETGDAPLEIWFGERTRVVENNKGEKVGIPAVCPHGIVAGATRSRKSGLCNLLINSLAFRYHPDDLAFYLIDGKDGVEFAAYTELPHAKAVALFAPRELMQNILRDLCAEMTRRNLLFRRAGNASSLEGYRKNTAGSPPGAWEKLPRVLLVIDEYQKLFDGKNSRQQAEAANNLEDLSRRGGSAGIHMFLASQDFSALSKSGKQKEVLPNIYLRASMRLDGNNSVDVFGTGTNKLIGAHAKVPGEIILNDNKDDDARLRWGGILELKDYAETVRRVSREITAKGRRDLAEPRAPVVFDGNLSPRFQDNPQLASLLKEETRPSGERWARLARAPERDGGFGLGAWSSEAGSLIFWAGRQLNIHGQAQLVFSRGTGENLLIIGEQDPAYGIMAAALCAGALNQCKLLVSESGPRGLPWDGLLKKCAAALAPFAGVTFKRREDDDALADLDEWTRELERRSALSSDERLGEGPCLIVMTDIDSLLKLQKADGAYKETTEGAKLLRLVTDGPRLGLHFILAATRLEPKLPVFGKAGLAAFNHRITTGGTLAAFKTVMEEYVAIPEGGDCFYKNMRRADSMARFFPYTTTPAWGKPSAGLGGEPDEVEVYWAGQFKQIAATLAAWKGNNNHGNE